MRPNPILLLPMLLAGAGLTGAAQAQPASSPLAQRCDVPRESDRVLLVVGNTGYPGSEDPERLEPSQWPRLRNAKADAQAICEAFAAQGFRVIKLEDASRAATEAAIDQFAGLARQADTALFYFAGHGFEYAGTNYLVPVDAPAAASSGQLRTRFVNLAAAVRAVAQARHAIVFLDACRTRDPVVSISDSDPDGPDGPAGTINLPGNFEGVVFYSTARGKPAFDAAPQDEPNSPFAKAVIARLGTPDLELSRYFAFVRADVKERTILEQDGPQVPTPYGVFDQEFYFKRAGSAQTAAPAQRASSSGSAVVVRSSGPSAASFPAGLKIAPGGTIKLVAGDVLIVLTPAGTRTFRGPGTFDATARPVAAAAAASLRVLGGIRDGATPAAPGAGSQNSSVAAQLKALDAGRARAALAALTPEMMRREDEPQLIARLLGKASAGDVAALAAAGDATAQYLHGSMLYQGIGVGKDLARARAELVRAAQSGQPAAQLEYAFFLQNHGTEADRPEALRLYEAAAAQDWPKAQSHLAYVLWSAKPPQQDKARAIALWRNAADAGHAFAAYALGTYAGEVDEARRRLRVLAASGDRAGDARYCELQDFTGQADGALAECLRAAQDGFSNSMAILAQVYASGRQGPGSLKEARYWAKLAAAHPDLDASYRRQLEPLLKET